MCGFTAAVTLKRKSRGERIPNGQTNDYDGGIRKNLESSLRSSLELIVHRGPDAQDVWVSPDNTVGKRCAFL
jgi:asparagine synthase (glutamine-hydrolysing)